MSEKKVKSPYKAVRARNATYCGYVSIKVLTPNKAYKIMHLKHTVHEKFGPGELATIDGTRNQRFSVQIPGKYLKLLNEEQISMMYKDVEKGKNPFLVYRCTLPDGSFQIDIVPNSVDNEKLHSSWEDVPELDDSVSESDSSLNNSLKGGEVGGGSEDTNGKKRLYPEEGSSDPLSKRPKI